MQERSLFVSRRPILLFTLVALASLCAGRANAAAVFMWVANGSSVVGYSAGTNGTANSATAVTGALLTAGTGSDYFSIATAGTNGSNEDLYVADSGQHTLSEYSWNGTALTQVGSTVAFATDTTGGAISPQEIAIDGSGNLWTTSTDGQIVKYNATIGSPTIVQAVGANSSVLAGTRGIMIDGTTVYVTVEGYGSGGVYSFSTAGGTPVKYASLAVTTVGGVETGQMRGIAYDDSTAGDIFFADSTWGSASNGYICEDTSCTTPVTSGLGGPNELETGLGTLAASGTTYDCDVLYEANYYAGTIEELGTGYSTAGGTAVHPHCGTDATGNKQFGSSFGNFLTGLTTPSGIALSPGEDALGGASISGVGPTFISDSSTPEPGTLALMLGALLLALAAGIRVQRQRLQ